MLTTLYCDASFCPTTRVGGWAVWLRSDKGRLIESGTLPGYIEESFEAELAAIYAGVYRAVTRWPETEAVFVRSDCETAFIKLDRPDTTWRPGAVRLVEKVLGLRDEHKIRLVKGWVKGHQRGHSTEAYLNRRVDHLARHEMEKARAEARAKAEMA